METRHARQRRARTQLGNLLPDFLRVDSGKPANHAGREGVAKSGQGDVDSEVHEIDVHAAAAAELYSAGCRIGIFAAHRLHALKGYKRLGYRDAASYATEELAIRPRRFRTMVRLGKRLRRLPKIRSAFVRRQISWVQAEVLAGIARAADEAEWIDTARGRSVRQLKALAKATRARRRAAADSRVGRSDSQLEAVDFEADAGGAEVGAASSEVAPASFEVVAAGPGIAAAALDVGESADRSRNSGEGDVVEHPAQTSGSAEPAEDRAPVSTAAEPAEPVELGEEEYRLRRMAAPGWLLGKYVRIKPTLEKLVGSDVPDGVAVELIAAEFLSGAEARLAKSSDPDPVGSALPAPAPAVTSLPEADPAARLDAGPGGSAQENLAPPESSNPGPDDYSPTAPAPSTSIAFDTRPHPSDPSPASSRPLSKNRPMVELPEAWKDLDPDRPRTPYETLADELREYRNMPPIFGADDPRDFCTKDSPWELHRLLQKAVRRERQVTWQLGRMLREIRDRQLWRPLGYRRFSHYVGERLGISLRTAQRLIRVDREGFDYPLLTDAYRSGRLPLLKATVLLRVLRLGGDEEAWLRYAGAMTYQRLCDAIRSAEARAAADPEGWSRSGGSPPPIPGVPDEDPDSAPTFVTDDEQHFDPAPTFATSNGSDPDSAPMFVTPNGQNPGPAPTFVTSNGQNPGSAPMFVVDPEARERLRSFGLEPYGREWARQPAVSGIDLYLTDEQAAVLERAYRCIRRIRGADWPEWACLNDLLDHFTREYDGGAYQWMRWSFPILDRDGWRCKVPGCRARSPLHVHHVRFRSRGGGDEPENLVTLCDFHHLALHRGIIRCRGRAPDRLRWELGRSQLTSPRFKEEPIARFFGDRRLPIRTTEGPIDPTDPRGPDPEESTAGLGRRMPRLGMSPSEEAEYLREEAEKLRKELGCQGEEGECRGEEDDKATPAHPDDLPGPETVGGAGSRRGSKEKRRGHGGKAAGPFFMGTRRT